MDKIPNAEEFIKEYNSHKHDCGCEWRNLVAMRKFAELHVKAALEAAADSLNADHCYSAESERNHEQEMYDKILESYPTTNIQ